MQKKCQFKYYAHSSQFIDDGQMVKFKFAIFEVIKKRVKYNNEKIDMPYSMCIVSI